VTFTEAVKQHDILILGVGNPIMGDDGAGIRAVELLSERELPANVLIQEAGTPGWGLVSWLEGFASVILVDAVQMGQPPGTWRRFKPDEVELLLEDQSFSLHEPDLACGLALAEALDGLPENLVIYGIEPAQTTPGAPLSPEITANLQPMVDTIADEVKTYRDLFNQHAHL
jgi:hydrogenase maturation protease